jgi:hypothetical protein
MKAIPVILFLLIFSLSFEANAQCQTGFTPRTVNMNVNGCMYQVDICVKCPFTSGPTEVYIRSITQIPQHPPCTQSWTFQQVHDYINSQLQTSSFLDLYMCQTPYNPPPCPDQSDPIIFRHWVCWNIELISYFGEDHIVYRPCDYDNWCEEIFTVCKSGNNYQWTRISGPTLIGTVSCTLEGSSVPIPTQYNTPTSCYIYHTPCNP